METIVSDIAKMRMERDVNDALNTYGLFVTDIRFDATSDLCVVIELGAHDDFGMVLTQ